MLYSATVTIAAGSAGDAAMTAAKSLEALRTHLPAPLQSLQYSVALNPSQAAIEAQRMVVLPQLVDDARKLAQSLAAATGVGVGNIRSISDSGGGAPVGAVYPGNIVPVGMIGAIYDPVLVPQPALPSSTQYTFSLTVVFATVP
jgi:uncharacterized protein YggE